MSLCVSISLEELLAAPARPGLHCMRMVLSLIEGIFKAFEGCLLLLYQYVVLPRGH